MNCTDCGHPLNEFGRCEACALDDVALPPEWWLIREPPAFENNEPVKRPSGSHQGELFA